MAHAVNFKKQWWVSFVVIFGAIAASAVGLYYLSNAAAAQSAKIVSDRDAIASQATAIANLAKLKNDEASSGSYLSAMQKLLPSHDALIGLPQWITSLAQKHNVTATFAFTGQKTAATKSSPGTDAFSLYVSGTSDNIVSFLSDLETTAPGYLVSITSFDLTNTGNSNFTFTAQGEAFSH